MTCTQEAVDGHVSVAAHEPERISVMRLPVQAPRGSTRSEFVDDYLRMVRACAERDRTEVILRSTRMGFLTGAQAAPRRPHACPVLPRRRPLLHLRGLGNMLPL